jgi:hypothetical protein
MEGGAMVYGVATKKGRGGEGERGRYIGVIFLNESPPLR